ncbi:expressed unknown protein [Seminavis robusta]|uniref:Uncharacterized protein n=1 Tax=Seminavis robusta TaxID=568900 RepID=A0A9N8EHM5_9STRA|nr:expressed unknown protein [Seminavis robusta]|eukprot:Sro950_g223780.1 n/a (614) ;mRNA; f:26934-28867
MTTSSNHHHHRVPSFHLLLLSILAMTAILTWLGTHWIFYYASDQPHQAASILKVYLEESKQQLAIEKLSGDDKLAQDSSTTSTSSSATKEASLTLPTKKKSQAIQPPKLLRGKVQPTEQPNRKEEQPKQAASSQEEPQKQLLEEEEDHSVQFHFIISTQCSSYQLWETLTTFHSAEAVHQCGQFTWIVSGCLPDHEHDKGKGKGGANSDNLSSSFIRKRVHEHFPPEFHETDCSRLHPNLHFTPDFSDMSVYGGPYANGKKRRIFTNPNNGKTVPSNYGNHYYFNNKPNGLLHWATAQQDNQDVDEAIVLIDPDFLFLARFHLARPDMSVVGHSKKKDKPFTQDKDLVYKGKPAAASYGLGAQWLDFNRTHICGADSPCVKTTQQEVHKHYSAGPPYVIHRADVLPLATKWAALVPATYDEYPLLYAEMYAYSMAAAHLQLPHHLINGLFTGCMVGWPNPKRWDNATWEAAERKVIEQSAQNYRVQLEQELVSAAKKKQPIRSHESATSCFVKHHSSILPPMLHYCRRYMIPTSAEMKRVDPKVTYRFFAKRRMEHNTVLDCNDNNYFYPFDSTKDQETIEGGHADWNALAVCAIARTVNFARHRGCERLAAS